MASTMLRRASAEPLALDALSSALGLSAQDVALDGVLLRRAIDAWRASAPDLAVTAPVLDQLPELLRAVADQQDRLGSFVGAVSTGFWSLDPVGVTSTDGSAVITVDSAVGIAVGLGTNTVTTALPNGTDAEWTVTQTSGGRTWTWNPVTRTREWSHAGSGPTTAGSGPRSRVRLDTTIQAPFVAWTGSMAQAWSKGASVNGSHTAASAGVTVGQSAYVSGSVGMTSAGIGVAGAVHYEVGVRASADVAVFAGPVGAGVGTTAFVGARADADVQMGVGLNGVHVEAHAGAHVGGEADVHATVTVAGVTGGATAGLSWWAGAEVDGDLELGWQRLGTTGTFELTLGVGITFGYDLSIDPATTLKTAGHAASAALDGAGKAVDSVTNAVGSVTKHLPKLW
jgi:hypothetical protein